MANEKVNVASNQELKQPDLNYMAGAALVGTKNQLLHLQIGKTHWSALTLPQGFEHEFVWCLHGGSGPPLRYYEVQAKP